MTRTNEVLNQLIEPVLISMGYELVGIEYRPNPKSTLLRIYIDSEKGVTVDDCGRVSHQISGILDVEDPIPDRYTLEVSSPGLDRPLFKASDYDRFAGERIKVRLQGMLDGRRRVAGVLRGLRDECVVIDENGTEILVPLSQVDKANLELEATPRGGDGI